MKKSYSYDLSGMNVGELTEFLQSLPKEYRDWPIYCCGNEEMYLNADVRHKYLVMDEQALFSL